MSVGARGTFTKCAISSLFLNFFYGSNDVLFPLFGALLFGICSIRVEQEKHFSLDGSPCSSCGALAVAKDCHVFGGGDYNETVSAAVILGICIGIITSLPLIVPKV